MDSGARGGTGRPAAGPAPGSHRIQLILAGLLVALVIFGVRAGPALRWKRSWQGPWHAHGAVVGLALEAVLAALLVALWAWGRRSPDPGWPAMRLRATLLPVIALAMVVLGIPLVRIRFSLGQPRHKPPRIRFGYRPPRSGGTSPATHGAAVDIAALEYALLALVVLAVVAAFVVLLRRRRYRSGTRAELGPEDDDSAALRTAVQAGRAALTGLTEARMAIIACYLAMERSLAEAGAARAAAETPDELLARGSAAGLLRGDPPATLTGLFYQARFSSRALPPGARDTALAALDAISADLRSAARISRDTAGSAAGP